MTSNNKHPLFSLSTNSLLESADHATGAFLCFNWEAITQPLTGVLFSMLFTAIYSRHALENAQDKKFQYSHLGPNKTIKGVMPRQSQLPFMSVSSKTLITYLSLLG
jgi:hypothetical protein